MSEENKSTTVKKVEKKDTKRCIVVALLILSIITNIASAWYFSNSTYEKIMKNEYAKVNKINLLRIGYSEIKNINWILENEFKKYNK